MTAQETVSVLIPTINRLPSLVMTLSGIAGQSHHPLDVVVADQSDRLAKKVGTVQALCRIICARGGSVRWHHRRLRHGIAEQRDFLLRQAQSEAVLFVDDDVFLEPWVVGRLLQTLRQEQCGFVGAFPVGLSYIDDVRPQQQRIEYWQGPVQPERVEPESRAWQRFHLHRATNLYHVAQRLPPGEVRRYKVAWVGACALYDREKLLQVGGFSFWRQLPRHHSGEEVLVQNLLLRRWGGCALIPSGAYHAEVPTTILNEAGTVDGHALDLLREMVARYAPAVAPADVERSR
jgi:GT2 family glycosyltransferase